MDLPFDKEGHPSAIGTNIGQNGPSVYQRGRSVGQMNPPLVQKVFAWSEGPSVVLQKPFVGLKGPLIGPWGPLLNSKNLPMN